MTQTKHDLNEDPGSVMCHKYEMISLEIQGNSPDTVIQTVDGKEILEFYLTNFSVHWDRLSQGVQSGMTSVGACLLELNSSIPIVWALLLWKAQFNIYFACL